MTAATKSQPRNQTSASTNFLGSVTKSGSGLPSRTILFGPQGIGKSSIFAYAPNPVFIMSPGETGLETLIDSGQLPETSHFPECKKWTSLLDTVRELRTQDHSFKSLVVDVMNGMERLCHEHVCMREYEGNWGEKGFASYQRGFTVALADWREFLFELDQLRQERKMGIFGLIHSKVQTFKNPEGLDYDRYVPNMHDKTWSLTHEWADMVLFANFHAEVIGADSKGRGGKGSGGQERVIYTTRHAAYDAKNRHGLPPDISMGNSGAEAWNNLREAVTKAKGGAA